MSDIFKQLKKAQGDTKISIKKKASEAEDNEEEEKAIKDA
jgi:hypothetical protein